MRAKLVRALKEIYFTRHVHINALDEPLKISAIINLMLDRLEELGVVTDNKVWELSVFDDQGTFVKSELHATKKSATLKARDYANNNWMSQIIERKLNT